MNAKLPKTLDSNDEASTTSKINTPRQAAQWMNAARSRIPCCSLLTSCESIDFLLLNNELRRNALCSNVEVNRRAEGTSELNRRLGVGVKGAAALESCGDARDYGRGHAEKQARCAGRWADRGAASQQPGSAAGARGSGAAEAKARPNVEVNRRAATLVRVEPQVRRWREGCCGL